MPNWLFFLKGVLFIIHRFLSIVYGYQIGLNTKIGSGLYIGHPSSVIVNGNVVIGNNCNISHNVTIGKTSRGKKRGCPEIGDFVWIGPGSVIVGNIRIGNNVFIAANSVVNQDIQDNSRVYSGSSELNVINSLNAVDGLINNL
jgi:serine O-acetyltransferase